MYDEKNTDCALYGSPECALLNAGACLGCAVGKLKPEEQTEMKDGLTRLMEAAPEETVKKLCTSGECLLCKGVEENRGKAECFALFDMVRPDEKGDWSLNIGSKKLASKTGFMLLPLQAGCCSKCRRRYRMIEFLPMTITLALIFAALLVINITKIHDALHDVAAIMPAAVFIVSVLVALLIGSAVRWALIKKYGQHTEFDMSKLAPVAELEANGWQLTENKKQGVSKLVFAGKRRENGVYTRIEGEDKTEE